MTKIYYDYNARFAQTDRAEIIRKGYGRVAPIIPTKGVKVQTVELTDSEFIEWAAAKRRAEETVWNGFGGRR